MTKRAATYELNPDLLDSDTSERESKEAPVSSPSIFPFSYDKTCLEKRPKMIRLKRLVKSQRHTQDPVSSTRLNNHFEEPSLSEAKIQKSISEGKCEEKEENCEEPTLKDNVCPSPIKETTAVNEDKAKLLKVESKGDSPRRHSSTDDPEDKVLESSFVKESVEPCKDSSEDNCKPIFGNLFSQRFTNPFAEVAKKGEENFYTLPLVGRDQGSETKNKLEETGQKDSEVASQHDSFQQGFELVAPQEPHFLGEDSDEELYSDPFVVLLKCVPVYEEDKSGNETKESASKCDGGQKYKFKRQGEGILRILGRKSGSNDSQESTKNQTRIVEFHPVQQMFGGYGLRFVGIDLNNALSKNSSTPRLASYILKFKLERQMNSFLEAVKMYRVSD